MDYIRLQGKATCVSDGKIYFSAPTLTEEGTINRVVDCSVEYWHLLCLREVPWTIRQVIQSPKGTGTQDEVSSERDVL